jgi:hypothetical protein
MIKEAFSIQDKKDEIIRLGKDGRTTLSEVADVWRCSTKNIADYLHRLQEQDKYAYLIDSKGVFRFFQEVE